MKTQDIKTLQDKDRITVRFSREEKTRLLEEAEIAGMTISELLRRRAFGRKIVVHTDMVMIRELRRLGGLLKNNFVAIKDARMDEGFKEKHEELLSKVVLLIDTIGAADDYKES